MVPDSVCEAETRLGQSMEQYRQRCDNLGNSLHGLMDKIEDERFFGDLATEVKLILINHHVDISISRSIN